MPNDSGEGALSRGARGGTPRTETARSRGARGGPPGKETALGREAPEGTPRKEKPPARLDATGLNCPMPLLKAKRALNELGPGDRLEVIATDPGSVRDFRVFSEQSGHALLDSRQEDDRYFYLLQKASA